MGTYSSGHCSSIRHFFNSKHVFIRIGSKENTEWSRMSYQKDIYEIRENSLKAEIGLLQTDALAVAPSVEPKYLPQNLSMAVTGCVPTATGAPTPPGIYNIMIIHSFK